MRLVFRPKLTASEADIIVNTAQQFFVDNPRRRVFRIGDTDGAIWFKVRRAFILDDVRAHAVAGVTL